MSAEHNKKVMIEYFAVLDAGDKAAMFALIDRVVADEYVAHFTGAELRGRDDLKTHVTEAYRIFGQMHHTVEDNFAEGERLATRVRFQASHRGDFVGIPATGRPIDCPIMYVHRFIDGRIQEAWLDWDSLFVVAQRLGVSA